MKASPEMDGYEREASGRGYRLIAGIDEAGRGSLAGSVIAAAVILPAGYQNPKIQDSKTLTPQCRAKLYEVIQRDAVAVGIGVVEAEVIDSVNILQATLLAMKEAVQVLATVPDYLLIDGLNQIALTIPQQAVVKGDALSVSIAAASIVAKVSRDRVMEMYHRQFPQYNFSHNKGYATQEHREALLRYGRCKIHRCSFRVREIDCRQVNETFDF